MSLVNLSCAQVVFVLGGTPTSCVALARPANTGKYAKTHFITCKKAKKEGLACCSSVLFVPGCAPTSISILRFGLLILAVLSLFLGGSVVGGVRTAEESRADVGSGPL